MELDAVKDLLVVQGCLRAITRALYRRQNPLRQRLPNGFDQATRLRFTHVEPGSTRIPLEAQVDSGLTFGWETALPIQEASSLLYDGLLSQDSDSPLPRGFPRVALPYVCRLGEDLAPSEILAISIPGRTASAVSPLKRTRMRAFMEADYEDSVDVTGEIRLADLDGLRFVLRISEDEKIPGRFSEGQEDQIVQALRDHKSTHLHLRGQGKYRFDTNELVEIVSISELRFDALFDRAPIVPHKPIWEVAEQIASSLPVDVWRAIPADLATNLDKYLDEDAETAQ